MNTGDELLRILNLKESSKDVFVGESISIGSTTVFGGQVLAQALHAATNTVYGNRSVHSLHSYFLEAGDLSLPLLFEVERIRDGGSFSTRRVVVKQNNRRIFILAASFHKIEEGYAHQIEMKTGIALPETLFSWEDMLAQLGDFLPKHTSDFLKTPRPVSFKPVHIMNPLEKKNLPPFTDVWFKLKGEERGFSMPEKQQILTYISDYNILSTALFPHASTAHFGNTQMASLDHSMWFFRDFDLSDWMLFSTESPNTSGARGFTRGHIFTRSGDLVASVTQEGLMRPIK